MADGGHVLDERHADRQSHQRPQGDRAPPGLCFDAGGGGALTGGRAAPRIAIPVGPGEDALDGWDPRNVVAAFGGETMGTTWRVRLAAPIRNAVAPIEHAIAARLDDLVAQMSHWQPDSQLGRFNAAAAGTWVTLGPDFAMVMAAALDVAARSGGLFDPAIGRLVDAWGHGPIARTTPPDEAEIAAARLASGWRRLAFDRERGALLQPGGLGLDLSGIAKGYAVDAIADLLAARGFRHLLVEIGGECVGRGLKPDGDPWWVDLEDPPGTTLPPLRIALHRCAIATSGDYVRGAHTIDPRTGVPAQGVRAVSVIHRSAMLADAWASALMVADAASGAALAREEALPVRWIDAGGEEHLSPAMIAIM